MSVNISCEQILAIFDISKKSPQDEFSSGRYAGLAPEIKAALDRKFEARRAESAELAADAILKIIDAQEETEAHLVATIRRLRAEEQVVKAKLADLNKARAYADQTNNYLPLAVQSGLPMRTLSILVGQESLPRAAAEIPDDFKPVQRAEAEA